MLLRNLALINQANQSQALIHFAQIQNNVFLGVLVGQSDYTRGLFVELGPASFFVYTINTCNVDQNVNKLGADLIVLHIDGVRISSDIYFTNDIKQECFLDFGPLN